MSEEKQYAERDAMSLDKAGYFYCRHIVAMTKEALNSKSDIACELGWRDMQIAELQRERDALAAEMSVVDAVHDKCVFITDDDYDACPKSVQEIIRSLAVMQIPATEAYRNSVLAEGIEIAIDKLKSLDASPYAVHSLECALHTLIRDTAPKGDSNAE